jgi:hypothetical protein
LRIYIFPCSGFIIPAKITIASAYRAGPQVSSYQIPRLCSAGSLSPLLGRQYIIRGWINILIPVSRTVRYISESQGLFWIGTYQGAYFLYFFSLIKAVSIAMMPSRQSNQPDFQGYGRPVPSGSLESVRRYGYFDISSARHYLLTKFKRGICRNKAFYAR